MTWVLVVSLLLVGFGAGVVVGQWGMSYRLARIEGKIRQVAVGAYEHGLFDSSGMIPTEWVVAELDSVVSSEFR